MIYILLGLISASLFGIGAFAVYGYDGLMKNVWIDYVFWWLIGSSMVLALLDNTQDLRCRLCRRLSLTPALCPEAPCT